MRDLEIRGAGNLLGESQTGHIAAVGYDLYCQMVTEAVGEMKGEGERPAEVKLDVPTDAYLPTDYVTKEELREVNGTTVVSNGASLLLSSGSRITNEWLTLNGSGSALHPYALGSLSGTYLWSGPIVLGTDSVISTEPGDSFLTVNGAISGSGGLTKTGLGTLQLGGPVSNSFTGTTRVHAGALELDKDVSDGAIGGPLVIGDDSGGADADVVWIRAGARSRLAIGFQ